ncbi:hypothetical protein [uncultured Cohaesibacter sp.]|uniref:hypothetical protein n=1 Tax=uncultured Cohaesibacter sp. TaxID=1002546 RepID=UPI00292E53EB|nr:hypothetical protein [uncultured Cohaesibacter sp.]
MVDVIDGICPQYELRASSPNYSGLSPSSMVESVVACKSLMADQISDLNDFEECPPRI